MNKSVAVFLVCLIGVMSLSIFTFFAFKKMNCDGEEKFFIYDGTQYKCTNYKKQ